MIDGILALVVAFVIDGDTFIARDAAGYEHRIRLWGLDAPELDERGGPEARALLTRLIDNSDGGVTCYVIDEDRYGRTVARCDDDMPIDLACMMIQSGTASEWLHFSNGYYRKRGCIHEE